VPTQDDIANEATRRGEIDVLQRRGIPQARVPQPLRQASLLAGRPFGIDEQAETIVEMQFGVLGRSALLLEGLRHRGEMQRLEFLNRGLGQHKPPRSRWRPVRFRA
jgi:hypothetical protein